MSGPKNALTTPLYMHQLENSAQYLVERCTTCVNGRGLGDRHSCHAVAYRNGLDKLDVPVTKIVVVSGVCVRKESWQGIRFASQRKDRGGVSENLFEKG